MESLGVSTFERFVWEAGIIGATHALRKKVN